VTPGGSLRYGAVGGVPLARNESIEHITLANGTVRKNSFAVDFLLPAASPDRPDPESRDAQKRKSFGAQLQDFMLVFP
jgi:hypothetical protein